MVKEDDVIALVGSECNPQIDGDVSLRKSNIPDPLPTPLVAKEDNYKIGGELVSITVFQWEKSLSEQGGRRSNFTSCFLSCPEFFVERHEAQISILFPELSCLGRRCRVRMSEKLT